MENLWSRRDMMKGVGMASLALGLGSVYGAAQASAGQEPAKGRPLGECRLPPLPYAYDALEPHIDKATLTIHHDKHHAGYVRNFNLAMQKLEEARATSDYAGIKHWSREFAFNGSGHVLHSLYWAGMAPKGGEPRGEVLAAVERSFGGYDRFSKQFEAAANAVEGSGWGVLAYEPYMGSLVILQAEKHQDLTLWGALPLLVCDVWEHAYYLGYQNRRSEYVRNFMGIIHWEEVARRYELVRSLAGYR